MKPVNLNPLHAHYTLSLVFVRSSAVCYLCMGLKALMSPEHWARVQRWRKTERYIAVARLCLGLSSDYKQWDCYDFADFVNRKELIKTFELRHFPLSNGKDEENFGGAYKYEWTSESAPTVVKPDPETAEKKVTAPKPAATPTAPKMIYDVDKGCLVPFE